MRLTGRQITIMFISGCAAVVLAPTAVYAVTGSSVNITDPFNSAQKARVVSGRLAVTDGSGGLTVDGAVVGLDPVTAWSASKYGVANDGTDVLVVRDNAANIGLKIGTITLSHETGTGPVDVRLRSFHPTTAHNCAGGGTVQQEIASFMLPQDDTRTVTYTPGFRAAKKTTESCVIAFVFGTGTHTVSMTFTGSLY